MIVRADETPRQWRAARILMLDWYDGFTEGVCWFENEPRVFYFDMLDERIDPDDPDDPDDRLFRLAELPNAVARELMGALSFERRPGSSLWQAVWPPEGSPELQRLDRLVDSLESLKGPVSYIVRCSFFPSIRGAWAVDAFRDVEDWFAYLLPAGADPG